MGSEMCIRDRSCPCPPVPVLVVTAPLMAACPYWFEPQQNTRLLRSIAHVCSWPHDTWSQSRFFSPSHWPPPVQAACVLQTWPSCSPPLHTPASKGTSHCPESLAPQHSIERSEWIPHVWSQPADTRSHELGNGTVVCRSRSRPYIYTYSIIISDHTILDGIIILIIILTCIHISIYKCMYVCIYV